MIGRRRIESSEEILDTYLRFVQVDQTPAWRNQAERELERQQYQSCNRALHQREWSSEWRRDSSKPSAVIDGTNEQCPSVSLRIAAIDDRHVLLSRTAKMSR